jgi:fumarate reductase subunit C
MTRAHRRAEQDRLVASALQSLADTRPTQSPLPDPSFIWWKAQLLRRFEAEREATSPIAVGDRVHVVAAVLGALALAAGAWSRLSVVTWQNPAVIVALVAGAIVLVSAVCVTAFSD